MPPSIKESASTTALNAINATIEDFRDSRDGSRYRVPRENLFVRFFSKAEYPEQLSFSIEELRTVIAALQSFQQDVPKDPAADSASMEKLQSYLLSMELPKFWDNEDYFWTLYPDPKDYPNQLPLEFEDSGLFNDVEGTYEELFSEIRRLIKEIATTHSLSQQTDRLEKGGLQLKVPTHGLTAGLKTP